MNQKKIYILENLCCANCGAKIERKINELPEVKEATLVFATKQLRLEGENLDELLPTLQEIARSIEPDVVLTERVRRVREDATVQEEHTHEHEHEHGEECSCGCGHHHEHKEHDHEHEEHVHHHEHEEECGCGCGHHHHHDHEEHDHEDHDHHHEHGEECSCGCGHDHHHDHEEHDHEHDHEEHEHQLPSADAKTYIIENLGCANCAAKMERKINELPEVEGATITFATKQLKVSAENYDELLPKLQAICSSVEADTVVVEKQGRAPKKSEKNHEHEHQHDHSHSEDKEELHKEYCLVGIGVGLFVVGLLCEHLFQQEVASVVLFILDYILLGAAVLKKAVKNIGRGNIFDENFLMSVATIAALGIGDFAEAVGVMLFYRVGELFEEAAVERSRSQIMDAVDMRPETVIREEHGEQVEIPAEEANVGDIIIVRVGDRIPLDGVVVDGKSQIDTSAVTGEPVPVAVSEGDSIFSGCVNEQGVLKLRVEKPLEESMVSRILDSVENAAANKPQIDRFITRFARIYTPIVVAAALITAIVPSLITGDWKQWIYTAVTFLVISCPCALVLSVPLAFFSGIGAGSKIGILFKGGAAIEALTKIKAVVMDKTGTITKGEFKVQNVVSTGFLTEKQLLTIAANIERYSTHPIAKSILAEAEHRKLQLVDAQEVEEISGKGLRGVFRDGEVLCGNSGLMEAYGIDVSQFNRRVSGTEVFVAVNGMLQGLIQIDDVVKDDAAKAIGRMKQNKLTTAMLTGDAKTNATVVAQFLGIDEVHAKLLPEEKLTRLEMIRQKHGAVMFVGDGINDAPVLANADVGAAMGSGADAAIEAADVVFMNSSMESIPVSIEIAKKTNKIALQNVIFALAIKAAVMVLGLTGHANMWMAVFADTGVAILCILNSIRALYYKYM